MHRFFIEPKTLGYQQETYNRWNDRRWRSLVDEFRWSMRLREWKVIDRRFRLLVEVEEWDGQNVLLIANHPRDDVLVDAYVKAGFMEGQAIIAFADASIPWQRLKPFRAVLRGHTHRNRGAVAEGERKAAHQSPIPRSGTNVLADSEQGESQVSSQPNRRSGDPDTVAGGCLMRPKQYEAGLSAKEPSGLLSHAGRKAGERSPGSPEHGGEGPASPKRARAKPYRVICPLTLAIRPLMGSSKRW